MILTASRLEKISQLGCSLSEKQIEQINAYIEEIYLFNSRFSLIKFKEDEDLFLSHILDSLLPYGYFKNLPNKDWADAGSGSGMPGILLSIVFPEKKFTLIERSQKRCYFLESTLHQLGLSNVNLICDSLENVKKKFDYVTFRAFRLLRDFVFPLTHILKKDGQLLAYKGRRDIAEREREEVSLYFSASSIKDLLGSSKERCLIILSK